MGVTLVSALAVGFGAAGASAAAAANVPAAKSPVVRVRVGRALTGRPVRLNGLPTRAAHRGDRLVFKWSVIVKPRGSRPSLRHERRPVASLVLHSAGRYAVQLLVTERRGGRTVGSDVARVSIVPAPSLQAGTSDTPGPCVDQNAHPMGCPIQTITSSGGIQIGAANYGKQGNWVHLLVLDPQQLTPVQCGTPAVTCNRYYNADQAQELLNDLKTIPSDDDIVILSGQGISSKLSDAQTQALTTAFGKLGGTLSTRGATYEGADSLASGQWSLIGHTGATAGFAEQSVDTGEAGIPGFLNGSGGSGGSLNGYMQNVTTTFSFDFVSPEYVPIDTSAPGSTATQNVITVGSKRYLSANLAPVDVSEAIQVLVLDPSTGNVTGNFTYFARARNGTLDTIYLANLQTKLQGLLAQQTTEPPIIVVQSFGKLDNQGVEPLADAQFPHSAWVQDTLPNAGLSRPEHDGLFDYYGWCGFGTWKDVQATGEMDGYACGRQDAQGNWENVFPNDRTGLGASCASDQNCSITQAFGEMGGMAARNEVANIGYQQVGDGALQPAPEGLSFIGSVRPYNDDQEELHTGIEGERTIAVLRRSRQGQWEAASSSPEAFGGTPDDVGKMWQVVFGTPHQGWPLEGPPGSSLANASDYLVNYSSGDGVNMFPGNGYTDMRQAYVPQLLSASWSTKRQNLNDIPYPTSERAHFSRADFDTLKAQFSTEMGDLADVQKMIDNYESVFQQASGNEWFQFQQALYGDNNNGILSQVFKDEQSYENQQVTVQEGPTVGSTLYFAADALDFFAPEAGMPTSLFASAFDFFSELYSSSQDAGFRKNGSQPPGEPEEVTATAAKVGQALDARYSSMDWTLQHLGALFASDWGRLQAADLQASGDWNLSGKALRLFVQSLATSGEAALYQALMPVAYDQWVISPYWTYPLGEGNPDNEGVDPTKQPGPQNYLCTTGGKGNDQEAIRPFQDFPASAMGWVRWEGDNQGNSDRNHFTGRVLVSKADPLQLYDSGLSVGSDLAGFPGVGQSGAAPGSAITDKIFDAPSKATLPNEPAGLGLSRADFFAMPDWVTPRLQCGVPYFDQPN
jgi:hypothetical protein